LSQVLGHLPQLSDPNVLVGSANADDAGVYRISGDTAMVLTADFFTPIVDDPYWFGAIAASNALSDVYAMGGKALAALNIAALPGSEDFREINKRIIQGGFDKMTEAGVPIIGGHTIKDKEPKFGYAVLGSIHPGRILDNTKARPGDALVLTKPIGTGVIATGIKAGRCSAATAEAFTKSMATLNKRAAELMLEVGVSTATDITGFGLIGHAREMALASNVSLALHAAKIPALEGALECIRAGHIPGGLKANRDFAESAVAYDPSVAEDLRTLLFDPQTAGGLLISVSAADAAPLAGALRDAGVPAVAIGEVLQRTEPLIHVGG
jgi:selenide,water dikinase